MTWSYSGDPSSSPKDQQRYLIGDTDSRKPILQDEEINYEISTMPQAHPYTIAARLCEQVAVTFSNIVDKKTDSVSVFDSQRSAQYQSRAAYYRGKIPAQPYIGGLSRSDKNQNRQDPDKLLPYITVDSREFSVDDQAASASQGVSS